MKGTPKEEFLWESAGTAGRIPLGAPPMRTQIPAPIPTNSAPAKDASNGKSASSGHKKEEFLWESAGTAGRICKVIFRYPACLWQIF